MSDEEEKVLMSRANDDTLHQMAYSSSMFKSIFLEHCNGGKLAEFEVNAANRFGELLILSVRKALEDINGKKGASL